jgi:hypothetical protein
MTIDLYALAQQDASRLTLPAELAKSAGWPTDPKDFPCYGFFRSDGELLCCPAITKTANGDHPFAGLIQKIAQSADSTYQSLDDLPPVATLAMPFRFREFTASWVGAKQINLRLGSAFLSLFGWIADERPPIYPVAILQIICLFSQRKIQEIQRLGTSDFY